MELALGLLVLVAVVCAGSALGRKLNISVPLLLVLAGVAGSFLPFIPPIELNPELVLIGLLPPLLYAAALRTSLFDFGFLGQIGAVPGWPGADVYPPQPMVGQVRAVLDRYAANGGTYREEVLANCGHSPHIEHTDDFRRLFFAFLAGVE